MSVPESLKLDSGEFGPHSAISNISAHVNSRFLQSNKHSVFILVRIIPNLNKHLSLAAPRMTELLFYLYYLSKTKTPLSIVSAEQTNISRNYRNPDFPFKNTLSIKSNSITFALFDTVGKNKIFAYN